MKKLIFLAVMTLCVAACNDTENLFPEDSLYRITRFDNQPFLGETYINDFDYEAGNQFLIDRYSQPVTGGCSSFRVGGYAARNLDWYIRDYAVLVVHTAANRAKGRYASVALVSSNPFVNREMIAGGTVNDEMTANGVTVSNWRNLFPVFTTDGINEKGLCVNTNIVVHENGVREGYIPCTGKEGQPKTSFVSLPRYILDNCATADEAIQKCSQLNLCEALSGPLATEDSHIMVSDKDKTVVLEWYNNEMVYTEYLPTEGNLFKSAEGMPAIMTNFYNYIGRNHIDGDGAIQFEDLLAVHPYAMGVERYETLRDGLENVTDIESAQAQISKVYYTDFYDLDKKWYTENGLSCHLVDGVWYYPTGTDKTYSPAENIVDAVAKTFAPGGLQESLISRFGSLDARMTDLDNGIECENEWYTELTDIFDIENKELYVLPQQGWYDNNYLKFTVR